MGKAERQRRERAPKVVRAYVWAAKEILPTVFTPDSCLNGTRVCIEALAMHNVGARPLAVDMIAANEKANRMFEEHDGWPTADEDVRRWMAEGAWVLQIDSKDVSRKDGWPHHLIATTEDILIDSSLGQASRPEKNIELPWCSAFPRGKFQIGQSDIVYDVPNGATVGYHARPDVTSYMHMSGFQRHRGNMEIAVRVANRMTELLQEQHGS